MTTTSKPLKPGLIPSIRPIRLDVFVLGIGVLLMFLPTMYRLLGTTDAALWQHGEHSHGPIMLLISLWLLHKRWTEYAHEHPDAFPAGQYWAWPTMLLGALSYVVGRSLGIIYFEYGAVVPMMAGFVLMCGGTALFRALLFPLFFLIFSVPLPGFIVDPVSQFLKLHVTQVTTELLWAFGYPISHTGVIISIGPYQLLVADACAGMRTLFMLEAMGIFYINMVKYSSLLRNVVLALLIVPISFASNCIRVIVLALLTYHFGDEVGQGFLHGFAGIVLFVVALFLTISIDAGLRMISRGFQRRTAS